MKTYKIYFDNQQNETLIAHDNNKCVLKIKRYEAIMENKMYVGRYKTNDLTETIETLEAKGFTRSYSDTEEFIKSANKEERIAICKSLK